MRKEKGFEAGAFSTSERMIETIREILENEELDDFFCIEEILDLYHNEGIPVYGRLDPLQSKAEGVGNFFKVCHQGGGLLHRVVLGHGNEVVVPGV